jgi:hypothetical protein
LHPFQERRIICLDLADYEWFKVNRLRLVLDVAINRRPVALVTNNTKHFAGAGKRFGIPVLSLAELLEKMSKWNQDGD